MSEISIDITKLKPFNCKYYQYRTLLSKSNCIGYCQIRDNDLNLQYCKGINCEKYEKRSE